MTFQEAISAVRNIVGKECYFSVDVEYTCSPEALSRKNIVSIQVYTKETGWTDERKTFEEAVKEFEQVWLNKANPEHNIAELTDPPKGE
jgi:nucleoside-diphosphate-sugar epimerase